MYKKTLKEKYFSKTINMKDYFCWHLCVYKWGNEEEGGCDCPPEEECPLKYFKGEQK